jgi:hypothetical protein
MYTLRLRISGREGDTIDNYDRETFSRHVFAGKLSTEPPKKMKIRKTPCVSSPPYERTRIQTLIPCSEWQLCEYPYSKYISQRALKPASISQNTWSRHRDKPFVDYLPRLWSQGFFQMPTNILDAYGTVIAWFLRRWEKRCVAMTHERDPSTARVKIIYSRQTVLLEWSSPRFAPLFWLVVPTCIRTSACVGSYRNARLLGF